MKVEVEYVENSNINIEEKALDFFTEKFREWKKEKEKLNIKNNID